MNDVHPLIAFVLSIGLTEDALRAATQAAHPGWKFNLNAFSRVTLADEEFMEMSSMRGWNACFVHWNWSTRPVRYLLIAAPYTSHGEKKFGLKFRELRGGRLREPTLRLSTPYVNSLDATGPDVDPLHDRAEFYDAPEGADLDVPRQDIPEGRRVPVPPTTRRRSKGPRSR